MLKTSLDKPAVVYLITNSVTGKTYIGVTTRTLRRRLNEHFAGARFGGESRFYRALRKYDRSVFSIETLRQCQTTREALVAEQELIAEMKPKYNSTLGGDGQFGRSISAAGKARISAAQKGKARFLGRKHSDETKQMLRDLGHKNISIFKRYSLLGPASQARPVICVDDGLSFHSASAAAAHYGLSKSLIIEVCLKKPYRKTAGGKRFAYAGEAA